MGFSPRHYFLLFLIILLWAGNIIAIKYAVMALPPLTAATIRFSLAALVFLPFIKLPDRAKLKTVLQISVLMNVLHLGLLFIGLKMLDAASVAILLQTQVIFVTMLGWILFGESFGWRTWLGIGIAILGVGIMAGEPDILENPAGIVVMLACTLALAFAYARMKYLGEIHPATYVFLLNAFAMPIMFAGSLFFEQGSWQAAREADWSILAFVFLYQGVIVSATHVGWQRLLHVGHMGKISAYSLMIPFIGVMLSVLLLGEEMHWPMIVGGILTMAGVGIITMRRIQKGVE